MAIMLTYDTPRSAGVVNLLARAKRMSETQWTPTQEIGFYPRKDGLRFYTPARNGKTPEKPQVVTGMPYSSTRVANKFVGIDITFDTFLSAVENPASVIYQRDLSDFYDPNYNCRIGNTYFYYAVVCSVFADYVYDLPIHRSTYEWGTSQDFYEVYDGTVDCLQLGDCLLNNMSNGKVGGHIIVVTGIGRDEQGRVRMVELSEGVTPSARGRWYNLPEMQEILLKGTGTYRVFRYRYLDSVRPPEPLLSSADGELMLNYGDCSNYREGEMVQININMEADALVIQGTDTKLEIPMDQIGYEEIQGNTYRMYSTDSLKPDSYFAYCMVKGQRRRRIHFNVCRLPNLELTDAEGKAYPRIGLKLVDAEGKPLTKASPCLYNEDGSLIKGAIKVAMTDGQRLIDARIAVRERDGQLLVRPAATMTDEAGKPVVIFPLEEDVTLYAFRAPRNTYMRVRFPGGEQCTPQYLSWTEERVICYNQTSITANEFHQGYVDTFVQQAFDNEFANLQLYCNNEFGTVVTDPVTFVLD